MRVYLDNCCYNRPYDDQSQTRIHIETQAKLDIQDRIQSGHIELAASYILEAENAANPFARKRKDIQSSAILRERFDYTEWRQTFVKDIQTFDDLDKLLENTKKDARFNGNPDIIL